MSLHAAYAYLNNQPDWFDRYMKVIQILMEEPAEEPAEEQESEQEPVE